MRVQVNLATRPFVELRPFFLRLRLVMGALIVSGLLVALLAHLLSNKAERQGAELDALRNQTITAQQSKLRTEQRMRQPGNAQILDRAHFLNTLYLRKSFSWTAVMMDLENVLPPGVQVTTIEPGVGANGTVTIRLRVAGERDRAVQLVRNLERSQRFLQPRLGSESSQTREQAALNGNRGAAAPGAAGNGFPAPGGIPGALSATPNVEFEILANYNPLPLSQPFSVGHGRVAAGRTDASESGGIPEIRPATSPGPKSRGQNPLSTRRKGYPRDGVVLPPFQATSPASASPGGAR